MTKENFSSFTVELDVEAIPYQILVSFYVLNKQSASKQF